jgi:aspartyl-tRNA(Asn)/glutamyl-tRNA(Gln) amidotransferase subunit A
MGRELHQLGISELASAFRQGSLTPLQLCDHLLARIDDPAVNCNAFAHLDRASARREAQASTQRFASDAALGTLDGIPVAIKDVLDVAGMPTRFGSAALDEAEAARADCILVQRLRLAGAVVLGKTRTWEFAWRSRLERDPQQVVANPANQDFSPGGSSSGSAAAVAGGLCPLAFGTDSGGSVRGPASFCGIFGLKPGYAFIPVYPASPMGDIEHIGIFARSVSDIRVALDQVGGFHPDDPDSWPYRVPLPAASLDTKRLRIGYSVDLNAGEPEPELCDHFTAVVRRLEQAGLNLLSLEVPFCANFDETDYLFTPDAALSVALVAPERQDLIDPFVLGLAQQSASMSADAYARAELARVDTRRMFSQLFSGIDALLTLTQETTANRLDQEPGMMKLTRCFNMTGQPAISIPAGSSRAGMPIGIQLVCDKGREDLLLSLAAHIAGELA